MAKRKKPEAKRKWKGGRPYVQPGHPAEFVYEISREFYPQGGRRPYLEVFKEGHKTRDYLSPKVCPKGFRHDRIGIAEGDVAAFGKFRWIPGCVEPRGIFGVTKGKIRKAYYNVIHVESGLAAAMHLPTQRVAACVAAELARQLPKKYKASGDMRGERVMQHHQKAMKGSKHGRVGDLVKTNLTWRCFDWNKTEGLEGLQPSNDVGKQGKQILAKIGATKRKAKKR